jgi:hypothetical protein
MGIYRITFCNKYIKLYVPKPVSGKREFTNIITCVYNYLSDEGFLEGKKIKRIKVYRGRTKIGWVRIE